MQRSEVSCVSKKCAKIRYRANGQSDFNIWRKANTFEVIEVEFGLRISCGGQVMMAQERGMCVMQEVNSNYNFDTLTIMVNQVRHRQLEEEYLVYLVRTQW